MEKKITWEQLARYFAGELHGENRKKMESWIKADSEREAWVNKLYRIWKESEVPPYSVNVDDAWERLADNMDRIKGELNEFTDSSVILTASTTVQGSGISNNHVLRPGTAARRILLAAATVMIILLAGLLAHFYSTESMQDNIVEIENHVYETSDGERATYNLVDGSRVVLHAGSRIEVPENYNEENRELYLEGEAYFETVHDPEKPFIVHSQDTYTQVLGTRFLVQAWPEMVRKVEVVVSEGKVLFGDSNLRNKEEENEIHITQNQRAILSGNDSPVVMDVIDMNWHIGWTRGILVFDNRPLDEVISRLERWYAINIELDDKKLGRKRITAEIDYSQSMSEVLEGIALTLDLEIKRNGRKVIFSECRDKPGS